MSIDIDLLMQQSRVNRSGTSSGNILKNLAARFEQHAANASGVAQTGEGKTFANALSDAIEGENDDQKQEPLPKYDADTDVSVIEKDYMARWDELSSLGRDWLTKPMPDGVAKSPLSSMMANGAPRPSVVVKFSDIPGSADWLSDYDNPVPPHIRALEECPGATCVQMPSGYNPARYAKPM